MPTEFDMAQIDRRVGHQVRKLRRHRRLSQTELAQRVGVTFQQIQRYECARNRISASMLLAIAEVLAVPVAALFSGAEAVEACDFELSSDVRRFLALDEAREIAADFPRLSQSMRRRVVELLQTLAARDAPETNAKAAEAAGEGDLAPTD